MLSGNKLSKESAKAMSSVAQEGESTRDAEFLSSTGTSTRNPGDTSESSSFSLARQETLMLLYSKRALILVITTFAITLGVVTYKISYDQEKANFENKFDALAKEISASIADKLRYNFESLEQLSTEITTDTVEDGTVWPFVHVHNFEVKGALSNQDTGANTLSLIPLVQLGNIEKWDTFSLEESTWIEDGHYVAGVITDEIFHREKFNYSAEQEPEGAPWYEEGITPFIWSYADGGVQDSLGGNQKRERVQMKQSYAPIWQTAPSPDFASLVNMDLRSLNTADNVGGIDRAIQAMLDARSGVMTEVADHHHLLRHYDHAFPPEDMVEPHSYAFQPVYDTLLAGNRTIVAFLASFIPWGAIFTNVVSSQQEGIVLILENNCGQAYTYELFGRDAMFYGHGDLHDVDSVSFDGEHFIKAVSKELEENFVIPLFPHSTNKGVVNREEDYSICQFEITLYPDYEFRDAFFTKDPIIYAVCVVACFAITTLCFIAYDTLVQRRQKLVMDQAKKTTAIVNSLFPANVRERLLDEVQESGKTEANKAAFLANRIKNGQSSTEPISSESIYGSQPIADLFPSATVMFADIVGFTAWSSIREPAQVFCLLETVYHGFDVIAARRRIFKVETVGDCYVAVAGLPTPRRDHAIAMAKFADDCLHQMKDTVNSLDKSLGPGTSALTMRFGLHTGQVTAGVLRGEKGRFQLFGDAMNIASRMEATCLPGRIQVSSATAEILSASKKEKWINPRTEIVMAKGLGAMQTYWLRVHAESECTGSRLTSTSMDSADQDIRLARENQKGLILTEKAKRSDGTALGSLPPHVQRMVEWNVAMVLKLLQKIVARRASKSNKPIKNDKKHIKSKQPKEIVVGDSGTVLDEVQDILALPHFDAKAFKHLVNPDTIKISDEVVKQLTDYLAKIAGLYRNNPFHNFDHASHVTMSISKLLSRIVSPIEVSTKQRSDNEIAENLHDHTFGITSDPLTQLACIISGLIHDADHPGVPNSVLVKEQDPLAEKYRGKSVAEQNSVDLAWNMLMADEYKELRGCIYCSKDEFDRFRSIVVNIVMATDIMDKELGAKRKQRWEKAFSDDASKHDNDRQTTTNRKATIVLEHLMQASDVAHTMQHWTVYCKFNERLFREMYKVYKDGRSEVDPSQGWYKGELGFFDYYIIPLAKKLDTCGVFGVSSQEYLNYALSNRNEWSQKGESMVQKYMERLKAEEKELGLSI